MDKDTLAETIKRLEKSLQLPDFRKNPAELNKLIADEFIEIGKSGKVWNKSGIIEVLINESSTEITMTDFALSALSENLVLVIYTAGQITKDGSPEVKSMRSSIWKLFNNEWKIIFHQGTLLSNRYKVKKLRLLRHRNGGIEIETHQVDTNICDSQNTA